MLAHRPCKNVDTDILSAVLGPRRALERLADGRRAATWSQL